MQVHLPRQAQETLPWKLQRQRRHLQEKKEWVKKDTFLEFREDFVFVSCVGFSTQKCKSWLEFYVKCSASLLRCSHVNPLIMFSSSRIRSLTLNRFWTSGVFPQGTTVIYDQDLGEIFTLDFVLFFNFSIYKCSESNVMMEFFVQWCDFKGTRGFSKTLKKKFSEIKINKE